MPSKSNYLRTQAEEYRALAAAVNNALSDCNCSTLHKPFRPSRRARRTPTAATNIGSHRIAVNPHRLFGSGSMAAEPASGVSRVKSATAMSGPFRYLPMGGAFDFVTGDPSARS